MFELDQKHARVVAFRFLEPVDDCCELVLFGILCRYDFQRDVPAVAVLGVADKPYSPEATVAEFV
jgi:hypothetical protein